MIDEGYTKFAVDWVAREPLGHKMGEELVDELDRWRRPLHEAGLIGIYADAGIGYGNISKRMSGDGLFVISGTQTGHLARTDRRHYALVIDASVADNRVRCAGAVQASSESLTHAALYGLDPSIKAVVHVHHAGLWRRHAGSLPTTDASVAYGTPAMAGEFERLYRDTGLVDIGVAVMAGHEAGLVSIGRELEEAASRILSLYREFSEDSGR